MRYVLVSKGTRWTVVDTFRDCVVCFGSLMECQRYADMANKQMSLV